ncbi:hypothetical protein ABB55_25345 [Prosthecomicrobium hirschii]|uniref:Uncharacterized protein n=2 Tax=Prosthecodimorpha hirschii TaxID=665126 RepID=A0A0P6VQT2_9HYPH|nr:hypothetical protein ABB55_25345 [Prosthecomicrobium hirschii]
MGIEVRSGQDTAVKAYYVVRSDCTGAGAHQVSIRTPPANGTARLARITWTIEKGDACAGEKTKATVLYYRSRPGFRGTDTITVQTIHQLYMEDPVSDVTSTYTVTIEVK